MRMRRIFEMKRREREAEEREKRDGLASLWME